MNSQTSLGAGMKHAHVSQKILLLTGSMDIAVDIVLFIQKTVIIYYFYRVVSLISFAYVVWDKPPCRFQPLWYTALIIERTDSISRQHKKRYRPELLAGRIRGDLKYFPHPQCSTPKHTHTTLL